MIPYHAPINDMTHILKDIIGLERLSSLPGFDMVDDDLVDAVLDQAGKLATDILAPLNTVGDHEGSVLENGVVRTPKGFKQAYDHYVEGGWNSLPFTPDYGGQGMPWALAFPVQEMWQSANMSFGLCPLLNQGAVDLITEHGSTEQKDLYLEKMITGEWTGSMNLTEPQAGSDVGAVRTKATPNGDHYLIKGNKIWITYGEHDWTDNIIHLVLARLPDAPAGSKGISLFIVPKFLVNADGSLGERNDLRCTALEHKLGIHASPTCYMTYGDNEGAIGYLVGEPNKGLSYMFTMMNNARMSVGLQGVSIAERAYQQAVSYARERVQSKALTGSDGPVTIINHADVRRMLLDARAKIEAGRGLSYLAATYMDEANASQDGALKAASNAMAELLTPVVKAWCTDMAQDVTGTCVQVHGGMGFCEETGIAQHYRDARILTIYEGTNGIQSNDLVFRKVLRDGGKTMTGFIAEMRDTADALAAKPGDDATAIADNLKAGLDHLETATGWILENGKEPEAIAAGAVAYCKLFGLVTGGYVLARSALFGLDAMSQPGGANGRADFFDAKLVTAVYFAQNVLSQTGGLVTSIRDGHRAINSFAEAAF
ncbi:MAG: acyl-CoA dehydrogenase [Alphaproteobacteria bacterium]|nr:acyl-CoA dehydrogenase [Alphaproteobacteria bacterium]MAS46646.1 acyl-CoA dehydrogenase [Alphaproteobacteria bacterium]MAX94740.1 acyl-CoA dehydrogenase [Alphaproteobacteria bacterium]MBN53808.1 acyl-CoA dehydrogenase [Alphaproteobacteria bacterium]OUT41770.1 MAG: acyl-CoA dehydrogenase [Micavibrio sp. TMED2]|tara:strand:+ start:9940 stop:11736 length:1797 start_codon:yes stop_codon:yes gene_type:complete